MKTRILLCAALLAAPAGGAASAESLEAAKAGAGALFGEAAAGETDRAIAGAIDAADGPLFGAVAGKDGARLQAEVRRGEAGLLRRTLDESPLLQQALAEAEKDRTWRDYAQDRVMDAAVASWRSSLDAGYLWGTAPAYATFHAAPPVVNVVGGAVLWTAGVVVGLGAGLLQSALVGHF